MPLGLIGSSTPAPNSLFDPVLGPVQSFFTESTTGGVGSAFVMVDGDAGVPLDCDFGSGGGGVGSPEGAGVDIDNGDFFLGMDF